MKLAAFDYHQGKWPKHSNGCPDLDPRSEDLPGKTSKDECRYLYEMASEHFENCGSVVELGSYLGRSAAYIGAGLKAAGWEPRVPLHCYDDWKWRRRHAGTTPDQRAKSGHLDLEDGADFSPYFMERIGPYYSHVVATKTRIEKATPPDGPIEFLFQDAPKFLPVVLATVDRFWTRLIDRSILICQDFGHPASWALPCVLWRLDNHFKLVHIVPGSTAGFRVILPLAYRPKGYEDELNVHEWPKGLAERAYKEMAHRVRVPEMQKRMLTEGVAQLEYDLAHGNHKP